jgi:transposase
MSKRDIQRIEVLAEVVAGRITTDSASLLMDMSVRQVQRLLNRYKDGGGAALIHRARGKRSNYQLNPGLQSYVTELVRQNYRDFGPTLAAEALQERHEVQISRETLRKWMIEAGLWASRKQRRVFHQPRLRRERLGELIQIDGSDHRWFEDRESHAESDPDRAQRLAVEKVLKLSETTFARHSSVSSEVSLSNRAGISVS